MTQDFEVRSGYMRPNLAFVRALNLDSTKECFALYKSRNSHDEMNMPPGSLRFLPFLLREEVHIIQPLEECKFTMNYSQRPNKNPNRIWALKNPTERVSLSVGDGEKELSIKEHEDGLEVLASDVKLLEGKLQQLTVCTDTSYQVLTYDDPMIGDSIENTINNFIFQEVQHVDIEAMKSVQSALQQEIEDHPTYHRVVLGLGFLPRRLNFVETMVYAQGQKVKKMHPMPDLDLANAHIQKAVVTYAQSPGVQLKEHLTGQKANRIRAEVWDRIVF